MGRRAILLPGLCVVLVSASTIGAEEEPARGVDIGAMAHVISTDPARRNGARAGRLEEFHADDIFPDPELPIARDGTWLVHRSPDGRGGIGLQWAERRSLVDIGLQLASASDRPDLKSVAVEYWSSAGREDSWGEIGQTPWQGVWQPLPGTLQAEPARWVYRIAREKVPEFRTGPGVLKVRWIFPKGTGAIRISRLMAWSTSRWTRSSFRLESDSRLAAGPAAVSLYNGEFVDAAGSASLYHKAWNTASPLICQVAHSVPQPSKADRTLLRVEMNHDGFSVAVDDVLSSGVVYVPHAGVLVTRVDTRLDLASYRARIAAETTVLQRVRRLPDQSLEASMQALARPAQNEGPTMLSLACDNTKFVVERGGSVALRDNWVLGKDGLPGDREPRIVVTTGHGSPRFELSRLDFGQVGINTTVRPPGSAAALPLKIGKTTYSRGLGLHASAVLHVNLDGMYERFESDFGVLPATPGGTVSLQVDVDGVSRFQSGTVRAGEAPRPISIPVSGAKRLTLRLTDAGDGISNDAASFGDARLIRRQSPPMGRIEYLGDLYAAENRAAATRSRHLQGKWLPVVINTENAGPLTYQQRTLVAPFDAAGSPMAVVGTARALGVVEYSVENTTHDAVPADLQIRFAASPRLNASSSPTGAARGITQALQFVRNGTMGLVTLRPTLLVGVDLGGIAPLEAEFSGGALRLRGSLPPRAVGRCRVLIPAWDARPDELQQAATVPDLSVKATDYWNAILASAMQVQLPEPLVEHVFRATQVHCLMAARNDDGGKRVEPWCAAAAYGPLDTESQPVILGMDLVGHREFTRQSLEYFLHNYNADGLLVRGYTLIGTGQSLWTLAEHYRLNPDRAWLERTASKLRQACNWIERQLEKTRRLDPSGQKLPEYGLMPPGFLADWNRYAYYMYANGQYHAGLRAAAELIAVVDPVAGAHYRQVADGYRDDILRAYRWNQARMPVVPLGNGTWVPPTVSSLDCFGLTRDFYSGVSAIGHDVEAGGNHLIPLGVIEPGSREADWIVDNLEDRWFLIDGIFGEYPATENQRDWFNRGGFAKLQPHYARTGDIHALRDDVKPFVRTYFNTFPVLLNRENLAYWEHMNHGGAWNKTHESAWFLEMTRTMLLTERGDELWLAPFVTDGWLRDGMVVSVAGAPTRFGQAGYAIRSSAARGIITATVDSPMRMPPGAIVLRLRHPEGRPMKRVTVDGRRYAAFDPASQTIRVAPSARPLHIVAYY